MHLKHTTLLFCHAELRPTANLHPHVFPLSKHGPTMSDTWLQKGICKLVKSQLPTGCTWNICPIEVLKIKGTTRRNVNKCIIKWNPFLLLAKKHHVTKITKEGYYGSFQSQHGEGRMANRLNSVCGGNVSGAGDGKALEESVTLLYSRFKWWRWV